MQTGRSEQVREPLPCEVIVMREDFGDALLAHALHRDAIGEAVLLVRAGFVKSKAVEERLV
jgi:hypothetical protein